LLVGRTGHTLHTLDAVLVGQQRLDAGFHLVAGERRGAQIAGLPEQQHGGGGDNHDRDGHTDPESRLRLFPSRFGLATVGRLSVPRWHLLPVWVRSIWRLLTVRLLTGLLPVAGRRLLRWIPGLATVGRCLLSVRILAVLGLTVLRLPVRWLAIRLLTV